MKYALGSFAALVSCLLFVQPSPASEQVGKVLKAKTSVYSSGNGGRKTLESGDPVFFLDRLSTNGTGVGEFVFDDGTKLAIGPSASIVVDQFVQKGGSKFQKFGVNATKGTFRWISGSSPSSAYQIKTPVGTMGIRGTAVEVHSRSGVTHVVLLTGSAKFCSRTGCEVLNKQGDYISSRGGNISRKTSIQTAFKSRKEAAAVFRFLGNPSELSPRFRVPGSYMLFKMKFSDKSGPDLNNNSRASQQQQQKPAVSNPAGGCQGGGGGNCGAGLGGGKGNGTSNEGKGRNK